MCDGRGPQWGQRTTCLPAPLVATSSSRVEPPDSSSDLEGKHRVGLCRGPARGKAGAGVRKWSDNLGRAVRGGVSNTVAPRFDPAELAGDRANISATAEGRCRAP